MDVIREDYASSPSPSQSPVSASPPCGAASFNDRKNQRLAVAQRLVRQRRTSSYSTREEVIFAFRGYVAKRRRRASSKDPQSSTSVATTESVTSDVNCRLPLFDSEDETIDVATDSRRVTPLRRQNRQRFIGHVKAVNEIHWHPRHPLLFLSASMDATVRLWNSSAGDNERCRRKLVHHLLGVKSAKWSQNGRQVLSGGYDGTACCVDAETGQIQHEVRRPNAGTTSANIERITTVHYHPTEVNSVLLGTDKGCIYCHDLRVKDAVTTYTKSFGDVHDLLFLDDDGQRFVSSAGVKQRDASNQTLLVWDWRSATLLYDRLDNNMLAHSCLRKHPARPYFVAQCSGNYASLYSSRAPYKCVKGPSVGARRPPFRFEGSHEVEGYSVQGSFSRDGALWASGDAHGRVVLYRTSGKRELAESFQVYGRNTACICAEFQPSIDDDRSDALLTGSFDGGIDLFK